MNSSSQPSTHSKVKRLYIVTGKGGVGKTTMALALTNHLKRNGHKVLFNSFDAEPPTDYLDNLNLPYIHYSVEESAETYIGSKLGSEIIAKWIMKTPFFHSLFHMLPGLGHMILMGHLIKLLEDDPNLTIVIDSPASGHAMSMLESTHNFKEMFGEGLIVKDIERMHNFLYGTDNTEFIVCTLPTAMAVQEAVELKDYLKEFDYNNAKIVLNASLSKFMQDSELPTTDLPEALQRKVGVEDECKGSHSDEVFATIPYLPESQKKQVEKIDLMLGGIL